MAGGGMHGGGMHGGGCAWQGVCMAGGHAWQVGMHDRRACMARGVCMPWMPPAADTMRYGDTVNERAVRILLECILMVFSFCI